MADMFSVSIISLSKRCHVRMVLPNKFSDVHRNGRAQAEFNDFEASTAISDPKTNP